MKRIIITLTVFAAAAAAVLALLFYGDYCDKTLIVNKYIISSKKPHPRFRVVFISDQHNRQFGENDSELIEKIKALKPDVIISGGDMVTRGEYDDSVMLNLFSKLSKIAPSYCVLGNHEADLSDRYDFSDEIAPTGVVLLDNSAVTYTRDGVTCVIGGMTDFPYYEFDAPDFDTPSRHFWDKFRKMSENTFSVLVHHQPEYLQEILDGSNIDLALCGHTHGGQIRLPFIGGVYSPNQGFFPKYDKGEFDFGSTKMIISAGLGNAVKTPRFNNCPEITVVDIE